MHEHQLGIASTEAPELEVHTWLGPDGASAPQLRLADVTEPLIYLYCFQSWCPGCHSGGFPTMAAVKQYVEKKGYQHLVRFIAVQTVFEGHETNTPEAARESLAKHDLSDIALGHDSGHPPTTMTNYRTGGTPWTVLIGPGPQRTVIANGFGIDPSATVALIDQIAEVTENTTPEGDSHDASHR